MRTAACSCGQLSISLQGDPQDVLICHCRECQKATGAPFGVSTYWSKEAIVDIRGNSQTFSRVSDAGRMLENHFCPTCGGRPFWYADFAPNSVGVALGNFEESDLPWPTDEYWTVRKHPWCAVVGPIRSHEGDT